MLDRRGVLRQNGRYIFDFWEGDMLVGLVISALGAAMAAPVLGTPCVVGIALMVVGWDMFSGPR